MIITCCCCYCYCCLCCCLVFSFWEGGKLSAAEFFVRYPATCRRHQSCREIRRETSKLVCMRRQKRLAPTAAAAAGPRPFSVFHLLLSGSFFLHVRHPQKLSRHTSSETLELLFFFFISCSEEVFFLLFCFLGIEVSCHATVVGFGKRAPIPVWNANEILDLGTRCSCCLTQLCEEQHWKSSLTLESVYLSSSAVASISSQKRRWEGRREAREGRRVG